MKEGYVGYIHFGMKDQKKKKKPSYAGLCYSDKQPQILSGLKQQRITFHSWWGSWELAGGAHTICNISGYQGTTKYCAGS